MDKHALHNLLKLRRQECE